MDFVSVGTLFSGNRHFSIPDYQREYSWGKSQNETLWNDIKGLLFQPSSEHFLGAIVTVGYEKNDSVLNVRKPSEFGVADDKVSHLLDGQQRITSLMLLFCALRDVIEADDDFEDVRKAIVLDKLLELVSDRGKKSGSDFAPRLFLKEQSGYYYCKNILKITCSKNPDQRFSSVKNMRNAMEQYKGWIADLLKNNCGPESRFSTHDECLSELLDAIKDRALLVEIKCSASMNEFQVFESLNGKGLNLTAVDRIKSIYMSCARAAGVDGGLRWNEVVSAVAADDGALMHFFVTFFFHLEGRRIGKVSLPDAFKKYAHGPGMSFSILDQNLNEAACLYGKLRKAESSNESAQKVLSEVKEMGQDQIYVPLYAAARAYGIDSEGFAKVAKTLLIFMVRFNICGRATNALDSEFAQFILCASRESADVLAAKISEKQEIDEEFKSRFGKYCTSNSTLAKYYLRKIEVHLRIVNGNGNEVPDDLSLEHIIPQSVNYEKWYGKGNEPDEAERASFKDEVIESIGNMALLKKCDNSAASNSDYQTKVSIYRNGSTRVKDYGKPYNTHELIKQVVDSYPLKFEKREVLDRAKSFSEYAVAIWPRQ